MDRYFRFAFWLPQKNQKKTKAKCQPFRFVGWCQKHLNIKTEGKQTNKKETSLKGFESSSLVLAPQTSRQMTYSGSHSAFGYIFFQAKDKDCASYRPTFSNRLNHHPDKERTKQNISNCAVLFLPFSNDFAEDRKETFTLAIIYLCRVFPLSGTDHHRRSLPIQLTYTVCVCVCRRQRHHKKFLDDDDFLDETGRKSRILSPLCVCVDGEDSRINITRVVPYSRRYSFSGTRHSYRRMITTNFRTWWFSSFSFLKEKIHVHRKWNYLGFKYIRTNEPFLTIDK